jgi:hypothetical protein
MARGSYAKKLRPQEPIKTQSPIPPRATRQLAATSDNELETETGIFSWRLAGRRAPGFPHSATKPARPLHTRVVDEFQPHPLERHKPWLAPFIFCLILAVIFIVVVLSAGIFQRPGEPALLRYNGGGAYSIQVGGDLAGTWQATQPLPPKVPIPTSTGPYSVLGKPTISADFINRVLAAYHSPAAGQGQALYALGVKYGIDPAFALAFFMHESTFGTRGEARVTLSLGNLRCIPDHPCVDQDRGGYASFASWQDGFQAWYELIRNLYVAQWGLTTVDQIIPRYAPTADHNNEAAYIAAVKHAIDTWRAGVVIVS